MPGRLPFLQLWVSGSCQLEFAPVSWRGGVPQKGPSTARSLSLSLSLCPSLSLSLPLTLSIHLYIHNPLPPMQNVPPSPNVKPHYPVVIPRLGPPHSATSARKIATPCGAMMRRINLTTQKFRRPEFRWSRGGQVR